MIGCPGTIAPPDFDFFDRFPAGRKLCNKDRTQILRAVRFDTAAPSGKVTVTFGDAEEKFEVSGDFTFTNLKTDRSPSATLTITYRATEASKVQFRTLIAREKAKARNAAEVRWPVELPNTQVFSVVRRSKPADPLRGFELTDESGTRFEFDPSQSVNADGQPVDCN
jgi:hypothetical protein